MALYRTFYILKHTSEGKEYLKQKTIDIGKVESWEESGKDFTRVCMDSGNRFTVRIQEEHFSQMMMAYVDDYGMLFTFNRN